MLRGHLTSASCEPAEPDQLRRERGRGGVVGRHLARLDDGFDLLTELLVRHAEHGDVDHVRMGDEDVLGLLRVDVHTP